MGLGYRTGVRGQFLRVLLFALLSLVTSVGSETDASNIVTEDVCQMEEFNATCPEGHIIVMISAQYGRMRAGRCITENYGNLRCAVDVLAYLDKKCSGKHHCRLTMPDQTMHKSRPCPKDFASYLEASYKCVKVSGMGDNRCGGEEAPFRLTSKEGYLSEMPPSTTFSSGVRECTWQIVGQPGQKVNISVINFSRGSSGTEESTEHLYDVTEACWDVAEVKDGNGVDSPIDLVQACRHHPREHELYVSRGNTLTIRMFSRFSLSQRPSFLLKYKVVGCANIVPNNGVWISRDNDVTVLRCNRTEETWYLTCAAGVWKGIMGNCTSGRSAVAEEWLGPDDHFPYGILITVAIGVALGIFFGGILLAIVVIIRRHRQQQARSQAGRPQSGSRVPTGDIKTPDMEKGYAPVLDEMGQFPVSAEIFPPTCPAHQFIQGSTLPPEVRREGRLVRYSLSGDSGIEASLYGTMPDSRHVYETTRCPKQHLPST